MADKELTPLLKKAVSMFKISATKINSLAGDGQKVIVEHRFGRDGGVFSAEQAMARLGLRDEYLKEDQELSKRWKSDREAYKEQAERAHNHYLSKARRVMGELVDFLNEFYAPQGGMVCATWIPVFDGKNKKTGSEFYLQAMINLNSRKLMVGEDTDYAKYLWAIKKATQKAHDKNEEITQDTRAYLAMGHASKDVTHFLSSVLKQDIGSIPLLGLDKKE